MQVEVPQICWHDETARIMSLDFYPNSDYLVTASMSTENDSGIRFWQLKSIAEPCHQYDLQGGHDRTVNAVRFSPNGQFLASGADDQMVVIWTLKMTPIEFGQREETV
jgi:chromatin assembly factor 1 subunit B